MKIHFTVLAQCAALAAGVSQCYAQEAPLDVSGKLRFHILSVVGPKGIAGTAAYAGVVHAMGVPEEWGGGAAGYGKRLASAAGDTAIRHTLALGFDTALRQDPRYFPAKRRGFFPRLGHAFAAVAVTRTDRGRGAVAVSRLTSAFGAAYLSNQWYPDRLNTVGQGLMQGGIILALDGVANVLTEFGPDLKRAFRHRK